MRATLEPNHRERTIITIINGRGRAKGKAHWHFRFEGLVALAADRWRCGNRNRAHVPWQHVTAPSFSAHYATYYRQSKGEYRVNRVSAGFNKITRRTTGRKMKATKVNNIFHVERKNQKLCKTIVALKAAGVNCFFSFLFFFFGNGRYCRKWKVETKVDDVLT